MANALDEMARLLLSRSIFYLGPENVSIYEMLEKPVPGLSEEFDRIIASGQSAAEIAETHGKWNRKHLQGGIAALMAGQKPKNMEEEALLHFHAPLKLPDDLRAYAAALIESIGYFKRGESAGEYRQKAIDAFPRLFERAALPVIKERLRSFEVTPEDIQRLLRDDKQFDPLYGLWLLAGMLPSVHVFQDETQPIPEALKFIGAILGGSSAFSAYRVEADRRYNTLKAFIGVGDPAIIDGWLANKDNYPEDSTAHFLLDTLQLPAGLNPAFDNTRTSAIMARLFKEDMDKGMRRNIGRAGEGANITITRQGEGERIKGYKPFHFISPTFLQDYEAQHEKPSVLSASDHWRMVPEHIRRSFEVAGFPNAEIIAEMINKRPGQIIIANTPSILIAHHYGSGHKLTAELVLTALRQPENARYAGGMAVNLLHDELRLLAAPNLTLDDFYGLETKEPETMEQLIVARLSDDMNKASRANPKTQHAVPDAT